MISEIILSVLSFGFLEYKKKLHEIDEAKINYYNLRAL